MPDFAHPPTFCLAFRKPKPLILHALQHSILLSKRSWPLILHTLLHLVLLAERPKPPILNVLQHSILLSERSWPLILHALLRFILLSKRPRSLILHALLHFYLALRETQASDFACPLYFPCIKLAVSLHETGCFPTKLSSSPTRNMYFPT